jgi:2,3-bisphosphoglycerate-independent phosphoglycerate mutase
MKKALLIIMDGWGKGTRPSADAIANAHTPFFNSLQGRYPYTTLTTFGEAVGLPEGQMGNSEVGHLNIGAGRIVYQELQRINVAIKTGELFTNEVLVAAMQEAKAKNKTLHLMGLVGDGGVHAHSSHLKALVSLAHTHQIEKVAIHAFTDGRDTDPKSGYAFLKDIEDFISDKNTQIASVTGRYFAMDRDKRWDRVKIAYDALVNGIGTPTPTILDAVQHAYSENMTDEFIKPIIATDAEGKPIATIQKEDVVICFNFRTDRCREITEVLTQKDFPDYQMRALNLHYCTFTEYDATFKNVAVVFHNDNLNNTLGEVLANNHLKQLRMAETEKYPHVTFFFSGGRETPFEGESRIMKDSPKEVATYDLKPEMSALPLKDALLEAIEHQSADFIVINFANADMVGHTGVWEAAIKAAETVDTCIAEIIPLALQKEYGVFLTADHGNSDCLINEDGSPNTAHTMNPVPFYVITNDYKGTLKEGGKLGDLAPTILHYMGLSIPKEMTGSVLI